MLCYTHQHELLWRMWPAAGWYCPECRFDVLTTSNTNGVAWHVPGKSDRAGFSSASHCVIDDERWPCSTMRSYTPSKSL